MYFVVRPYIRIYSALYLHPFRVSARGQREIFQCTHKIGPYDMCGHVFIICEHCLSFCSNDCVYILIPIQKSFQNSEPHCTYITKATTTKRSQHYYSLYGNGWRHVASHTRILNTLFIVAYCAEIKLKFKLRDITEYQHPQHRCDIIYMHFLFNVLLPEYAFCRQKNKISFFWKKPTEMKVIKIKLQEKFSKIC